VLVAHPERSADATLDGSEGRRRELGAGSLTQVNAQSLTGEHGEVARAAAWRLIDQGVVAAIASDAHGPTRPPALRAARRALLEAGVPHATAELLVRAGPCELLQRGIQPRAAVAA
jgi:protein-tyrosine phosphatase